jgi:NTP pyrophosphatase (non-canonical NTP hydrolase)
MVDLKELQKEVMRNKLEKGFNTTNVALEFCRAHEELSEAFAKHNRNQEGVAEEFADVMIFILGMCEAMGFDLEKELVAKIDKNKKRKYQKTKSPEGEDVFIRVRTPEDP